MPDPRPAPADGHDPPDAPRRELVVYSLGGILDEIGLAGFRNLTQLLTIGFGLSPMLAGFYGAIKVLSDGLLDPLVAHWSDRSRSRWGRRRPFLLAGGLLMAGLSWATWACLPDTPNVPPNQPSGERVGVRAEPAAGAGGAALPGPDQGSVGSRLRFGWRALTAAAREEQELLYFVLAVVLATSVAHTLYSASYWALGIELAPSYEGRTRAMAYRSVSGGVIGLISAGFLPFCFLPAFSDFREGALVLSTGMLWVGVPLSIWVFRGTHERTVLRRRPGPPTSFFRAVREIAEMGEFWRVTALYLFLGKVIGVFQVFGTFLIVYHVMGGDLLRGTTYSAAVGMLTTVVSLASVPLVVWLCNRWEKQNAFRLALVALILGAVLKYFCYQPERPGLIFLVPFFYGFGHSALYNTLATMMADVTDLDEWRCGERREGLFGAVVSVINKSTGSLGTLFSGVLVVAAGFDITKGAQQDPGVFQRMLFLFSLAPALAGGLGFLILHRYPLTRARTLAIKEDLARRRAAGEWPSPKVD